MSSEMSLLPPVLPSDSSPRLEHAAGFPPVSPFAFAVQAPNAEAVLCGPSQPHFI